MMSDLRTAPIMAILVIAAVLVFAMAQRGMLPGQSAETWTFGSLTANGSRDQVIALTGSTAGGATAGRYDSYDAGQGTDYVVPADGSLEIVLIRVPAGTAGAVIQIGYADDSVADSVAAPTAAVVLFDQVFGTADTLLELPVRLVVPAGKHAWARSTGAGAWSITAVGIER